MIRFAPFRQRHVAALLLTLLLAPPLLPVPPAQAAPAGAQAADSERRGALAAIERQIDQRRQALHVPGAALVVVRGDEVLLAKGFGHRDLAKQLPVTERTLFGIGSTTKAFTALACLMAADAGRLSLDDHPRRHLPYFRLQDADADRRVTVRDLLSHRTGVGRADLPMVTGMLTGRELIRLMGEVKPMAKLREQWHYQNTMYAAAGWIAANALDSDWDTVMSERIFRPLGMHDSNTAIPDTLLSDDHAKGYKWDEARQRYRRLPFLPIAHSAPAGSINSNAADLGRWLRFLINDGQLEGRRLVSPARFQAFFSPQIAIGPKAAYALGWITSEWQGKRYFSHNGSLDGFNTMVGFLPDEKLGFALVTNVSNTPLTSEAADIVFEALTGKAEATPAPEAATPAGPLPASDPQAKALLGTYLADKGNLELLLAERDGQAALVVAGQPPYPLVPQGKDHFTLSGLPDSFGLQLRRDEAGRLTTLLLKQPHGDLVLSPRPAYTAPVTVEALMADVVAAAGSEAALRQHHTLVRHDEVVMGHQGLSGTALTRMQAPNLYSSATTLSALGRPIATFLEYYDGKQGASLTSFGQPQTKTGMALADLALKSDFYGDVNWRRFKTVTITGEETVAGEPCYVVTMEPQEGNTVTNYYSKATHRLLKQRAVEMADQIPVPYTVTFHDYRAVDGVMLPFRTVVQSPAVGEVVTRATSITFNNKVPGHAFGPDALPELAAP